MGDYDTPGNSLGIAVSGNYAYVADRDSGLMVVDISNPNAPSLVGGCSIGNSAYDVALSGDYAYVCDWGGVGLQVIDVSDPTSPFLMANPMGSFVKVSWMGRKSLSGNLSA